MVRPRVRRRGRRRFVVARRLLRMLIKLFTALIFPVAKVLIMWLVTFIRARVLPVAEVLHMWLATLLIARSIFRNQAPITVAAIVMRLAFSWIDSILAAVNEAPSTLFSGYRGFWHFLRNLPEYRLWCSSTTILLDGLVLTAIFSEAVVSHIAWGYMILIYGWLSVLSLMPSQF